MKIFLVSLFGVLLISSVTAQMGIVFLPKILLPFIFVLILITYFRKQIDEDFDVSKKFNKLIYDYSHHLREFKKDTFTLFLRTFRKIVYFLKKSYKFKKLIYLLKKINTISRNENLLKIFKNKYTKKIIFDLTRILNLLNNLTYIKVWKQTFKLNISSTSNDFAKFVWADLLIMFIQGIIIAASDSSIEIVIFIFYFLSAFFPRLYLLLRRLKARNMPAHRVAWMFIPIVGWFITWIIGGSDKVEEFNPYNADNYYNNNYNRISLHDGFNYAVGIIIFISYIGFMIWLINDVNMRNVQADKLLDESRSYLNWLRNNF